MAAKQPRSGKRTPETPKQKPADLSAAERALRESEEQYRRVFENSLLGLYRTTPDGRILMVNPALVRMLGYTSATELYERGLGDSAYEPTYPRSEFMQRMERDGQVVGLESAWVRVDGSILHVRESARAIRAEDGQIAYYEGTVEDITERKRAEEELQLLSAIVEQSSEGIAATDLDGNVRFVNRSFAAMHGYTPKELQGKNLSIFHTPRQMSAVIEANRELKETGGFSGEIWHVRRDGSVFPTIMQNALLRDAAGNGVGMFGTMRDITERKQAEEALKTSEERYRLLIDNAGYPITVFDREGAVLLINNVGAYNLGGTATGLVGQRLQELMPDIAEAMLKRFHRVTKSEEGIEIEDYVDLPSGEKHWFWSNLQPYRGAEGEILGVQVISHDITARKNAEAKLEIATEELRTEHQRMTDQNIALTQVLEHIESQKQVYRRQICDEIEQSLSPFLEKLAKNACSEHAGELQTIQETLHDILTRDLDDFQGRYAKLTARETEICDMIRSRLSSKEIADRLNVSSMTISKHREQIRKKLGITNKSVNLATYLRVRR